MDRSVRNCLIAFGSNEFSVHGDARASVEWAVKEVERFVKATSNCSRFYATPAFPAGAGPDYVNAVVAINTQMTPNALLAGLHQIEAAAGRERQVRWGQRTLDIDLIAHGDTVAPNLARYTHWRDLPLEEQTKSAPDELILPHPRMQDRAFVLVPLCDVAPDWVHPVLGQTARALCDALPAADRAAVVPLEA